MLRASAFLTQFSYSTFGRANGDKVVSDNHYTNNNPSAGRVGGRCTGDRAGWRPTTLIRSSPLTLWHPSFPEPSEDYREVCREGRIRSRLAPAALLLEISRELSSAPARPQHWRNRAVRLCCRCCRYHHEYHVGKDRRNRGWGNCQRERRSRGGAFLRERRGASMNSGSLPLGTGGGRRL